MLAEILRLDYLLTECCTELNKMKPVVVGLQQYEYAAQLRDFEKRLEAIKNGIIGLPNPIIPSKGLTLNGAIYSTQMFIYAQAMGWNKIPEYLTKLFIKRRDELNQTIVYSDFSTDFFIKLNARLKYEEKRIDAFIDSLMKIYQENDLENIVDDFSYGGIVLQFLTPKDFYRSRIKEGMAKWSIYETEIAIEDWISNRQSFYDNPALEINVPFLNCLPINLRGEEISYLFFFLGKNCLLALQDMLNIGQVLISFPFLCRLQRC